MKFSVIVPARNEERFITPCLESIRNSGKAYPEQVEIIVVLNRCTDRTEEIALSFGARIVREDARNLARIRNAGTRAARGEILVTIDADSRMSAGTLPAIDRALSSGRTAGGGVAMFPERYSLGILVSVLWLVPYLLIHRVSGGLFWCYRADFEALKGFDEQLVSAEDLDFAKRLKAYGKKNKRPFSTLRGGHIITSCRKFDQFGDWYLARNPRLIFDILSGRSKRAADLFYYDIDR